MQPSTRVTNGREDNANVRRAYVALLVDTVELSRDKIRIRGNRAALNMP